VNKKGQGHDPNIFVANYLDNGRTQEIRSWCLWSTYRKWRHLTLKGLCRDPNILMTQYLENGSRYRLGYNGPPTGK